MVLHAFPVLQNIHMVAVFVCKRLLGDIGWVGAE